MSLRQTLASVLHLFVLLAFFAAGLFFVFLPDLPLAQEQCLLLIQTRERCIQLGFLFFFAASVLLMGFYLLNRGRYLRIQMGKNLAEIDIEVVRQTLEDCFKTRFPKKISLSEVEIPRGTRLEIGVSLAPLEEGLREELFIQAEAALETLLRERFGYTKPFHLIVKL